MKTLILVLAAFVLSSIAYSEVDEDCLTSPLYSDMPFDYTYFYEFFEDNPYNENGGELLLDTCNSYPGNWIYYGYFYVCMFSMNIFPRDSVYGPEFLNDSIVYQVDDMPDKYSYLKDTMEYLKNKFGEFHFVDKQITKTDTTAILRPKRLLRLVFSKYVPVDSVSIIWENLSLVDSIFYYLPMVYTSVSERTDTKIQIYPNPVSEVLRIKFGDKIQTLSITDLSGNRIERFTYIQPNAVNVRELEPGAYFLIINDKVVFKFIKI